MAQYKPTNVNVTNGSNEVVLVGVDATTELDPGTYDLIEFTNAKTTSAHRGVPYVVNPAVGPVYSGGNTTVTLTTNYAGITETGIAGAFQRDYTTDNIPLSYPGDLEPSTTLWRIASTVQSLISAIVAGTKALTSVNITGGNITGITDLAVADGGTGASTVLGAQQNLGLEVGVDVAAYIKNNYAGTTAPTVNDDSSAGYSAGSFWADTTASPNEVYRCTDASVGAAVWLNTSLELGDLGGAALLETAEVSRRVSTTAAATATQYAKLRTYSFPATNNVAAKSTLLLTPIGDSAHYPPILIEVIAKQGTGGLDATNSQINIIRNSEEAVLYDDFDLVTAAATNGTNMMLWMRSAVAAKYAVQVIAEEFDTGVSVSDHDGATWTADNPLTTPAPAASVTSAKIGPVKRTISFDMSSATGTDPTVTGLPFTPSKVEVECVDATFDMPSWGNGDGTDQFYMRQKNTDQLFVSGIDKILHIFSAAADNQVFVLSIGTKSFTLANTKTGSPTGTNIINCWVYP